MRAPLVLALALMGCQDVNISSVDGAPEVEILRPVEGAFFHPDEPVAFCAFIADEDLLENLQITLDDSAEGLIPVDVTALEICDGGTFGLSLTLSDAPHSLSLLVVDHAGNATSDSVAVVPAPNHAPTCALLAPESPASFKVGEPIAVSATVADDEQDASALTVSLTSNTDGVVWSGAADSGGAVDFQLDTLTPGNHTLTLTVTDERDLSDDCVAFVYVDPCLDEDNDGFTTCEGDCEDHSADAYPGGVEQPDGLDNDCNGVRDEGTILYDDDGDGFSELDGDCDDQNPHFHPGVTDIPDDGVDQDCSGLDSVTCFVDADGDGIGGTDTLIAPDALCEDPGESDRSDDCDDTNAARFPGGADTPADGVDQDCNGVDASWCFEDIDGDKHGSTTQIVSLNSSCDDAGEASVADDCSPYDQSVHPGASEVTNDGIDQDCDGADAIGCFADRDGDGYGVAETVFSADGDCLDPGESNYASDCDDTSTAVHPGAVDSPADGVDQDCSGQDAIYCPEDVDGDHFGGTGSVVSADSDCNDLGEAPNRDDCNDADANIHPGLPDLVIDGVDSNCDGVPGLDRDGDGHASPGSGGDDCDDGDAAVSPSALELRNGADDDCDKLCDEGVLLPGELLITEIMFDPAKVNDLTGEWFEVHNATAQDITLCKGWVFRDEGTDSYSNLNDIVITPGGRSLFVRSGDGTVNGGLPSFFDLAWGGAMSLSNTSAGDEIVLELDGVVIDRVAYTPWAVSGHAMQLDQAILDALDPSNPDDTVNDTRNPWCEATQPYGKGDLGTPGTLNDVCP